MEAVTLDECASVRPVMSVAYQTGEPVVLLDGKDECLVVMTPEAFERLLFDSRLLNCLDCEQRSTS